MSTQRDAEAGQAVEAGDPARAAGAQVQASHEDAGVRPHEGERLLLHACCGPCSLIPQKALADEGYDITICYVNPNIAPREEYEHRLRVLRAWAGLLGIPVIEGPRDAGAWEREVARYGTNRRARCEACYRLRLRESAAIAAREGFDAMATTLAVSPYQLLDACNRQLVRACDEVGIRALPRDFTELYPRSVIESRELGMYRQNYCGCRFSAAEAALGRVEAREARRLERDAARVEKRALACAART